MRFFRSWWLAVTGHLISGAAGIYEHAENHTIAGWWLFAVCWASFYVAVYLFYQETRRQHDRNIAPIRTALLEQGENIKGLGDLIRTRDTQIDQLIAQVGQLHLQAAQLNREIESVPRPAISLVYSVPPANIPVEEDGVMVSHFRKSDILVRNGSDCDAYSVYLNPATIGQYTVHSYMPVDIPAHSEMRIDYRVHHEVEGKTWGRIDFAHNIVPLLDEVVIAMGYEDTNDLLVPALTVSYRDSTGNRFESYLRILYHPAVYGLPRIDLLGSKQLSKLQIEPAEPSPESTTHENPASLAPAIQPITNLHH
jgi:hypothetical protein